MKTLRWSKLLFVAAWLTGCETSALSTVTGPEENVIVGQDVVFQFDSSTGKDTGAIIQPMACTREDDCRLLLNDCAKGACVSGFCAYIANREGEACDDNDPCTVSSICTQGQCTGTSLCMELPEQPNYFPWPPPGWQPSK